MKTASLLSPLIMGESIKGHGGKTMEEMETPFIIAGKKHQPGDAEESDDAV